MLGMHWIDIAVLVCYFALILYIGVIYAGKKTETLGDFFVAGGKWGPVVSFIFIFASAIAGNEAVVVAKGGYSGGLSGVWYWWSFLIATPVYYVFAIYYKRARVYNLAEFLAMRYNGKVASFYSVVAGVICVLFIGMFILAIGKILAGMVTFSDDFQLNVQICIWTIAIVVSLYVGSGGMMSALFTDLIQGVMCLFILGFVGLPFLWDEVGGYQALKALPTETWDMASDEMGISTILALNIAALVGGVAAPWIFNWISISKDEKSATQCGWGHLWKRVITLVFALYGILFLIYNTKILSVSNPELSILMSNDPELAWGITMKNILPPFFLGLLVASFFAAAMSSADTYATTTSAMFIDYFYRKIIRPTASQRHYLNLAKICSVLSILLAAATTGYISNIGQYIKLTFNLLCFLGVPIYFGVFWRKANSFGMWLSFILGSGAYFGVLLTASIQNDISLVEAIKPSFEMAVFLSSALSLIGMIVGSLLGQPERREKLNRFYTIMNTPIGHEGRLVKAGIDLPSLKDEGFYNEIEITENPVEVERLYTEDSKDKFWGTESSIELRREKTLPWFVPGFIKICFASIGLVFFTWLITRFLFVW